MTRGCDCKLVKAMHTASFAGVSRGIPGKDRGLGLGLGREQVAAGLQPRCRAPARETHPASAWTNPVALDPVLRSNPARIRPSSEAERRKTREPSPREKAATALEVPGRGRTDPKVNTVQGRRGRSWARPPEKLGELLGPWWAPASQTGRGSLSPARPRRPQMRWLHLRRCRGSPGALPLPPFLLVLLQTGPRLG